MQETLPTPKGTLVVDFYDASGNFLGQEISENLIVATGRQAICHLLAGDTTNWVVNKIGFGTNGTATALTDTALTGAFIKSISSVTYPTTTSVTYNFTLATTEANGMSIVEFGLITDNGALFSRLTRGAIAKTSAISLICTYTLTF